MTSNRPRTNTYGATSASNSHLDGELPARPTGLPAVFALFPASTPPAVTPSQPAIDVAACQPCVMAHREISRPQSDAPHTRIQTPAYRNAQAPSRDSHSRRALSNVRPSSPISTARPLSGASRYTGGPSTSMTRQRVFASVNADDTVEPSWLGMNAAHAAA